MEVCSLMGQLVLTDSLQSYLSEVNRYPVLSQDEEFKVAERYYKERRMEDAHILVTSNLRYVVKIALEFRSYGLKLADLIQEGNIGLMVAVKKFNPYKGFRLITYATWWIKSFMQEFILRSKGIVKRANKALKKKLFYKNGKAAGHSEDASFDAQFAEAGDLLDTNDLSLNANLSDEKTTYLDLLKDAEADPVEAVSKGQDAAIVKREVKDALALLNEKERVVIENRVMSEEPRSLQELGDSLGLTRERVRQIENEALRKLGKTLLKKLGPDFLPEPA